MFAAAPGEQGAGPWVLWHAWALLGSHPRPRFALLTGCPARTSHGAALRGGTAVREMSGETFPSVSSKKKKRPKQSP